MIWVTDAKVLPNFRLYLCFSDGTEGEVDLKNLVEQDTRPIVAELRDPSAFAVIRVEMDTVVWGNGFDLAPEFLYELARVRSTA